MTIDIGRIYTLLAQRPQIRTVEIADIIDCEPEQVEPRLAEDIAAGRVLVHKVTAPNGRPANGFEFSPAFMLTAAFRDIAGTPEAEAEVAAPAQAPVPPPVQPAKASAGKAANLGTGGSAACRATPAGARVTHPERAIQFIRECGGRANNEALRETLGLGAGAAPSSYLHTAVVAGRLARDGRDWVLGANADVAPRYSPGKTAPRAIPAPGALAASAVPAPAAFRCARWSDGVLELQRGGETIAILAPAEQGMVMAMLVGAA